MPDQQWLAQLCGEQLAPNPFFLRQRHLDTSSLCFREIITGDFCQNLQRFLFSIFIYQPPRTFRHES